MMHAVVVIKSQRGVAMEYDPGLRGALLPLFAYVLVSPESLVLRRAVVLHA